MMATGAEAELGSGIVDMGAYGRCMLICIESVNEDADGSPR